MYFYSSPNFHNSFATGSSRRVHGYTSLVVDSTSSRLFASCTDDIIYAYDLTTYGYVIGKLRFFQSKMNEWMYELTVGRCVSYHEKYRDDVEYSRDFASERF